MLKLKIDHAHPVFRHLVRNTSVGSEDALKLKMPKDQILLLLKHNILATHPNKTYTFHDEQGPTMNPRKRERPQNSKGRRPRLTFLKGW